MNGGASTLGYLSASRRMSVLGSALPSHHDGVDKDDNDLC